MSKRLKELCFVFFMSIFLLTPSFAKASTEIVFCASISENLEPIGISNKFETNIISWYTANQGAYGTHQLVFTVYTRTQSRETLFYRGIIDVNPAWDSLVMSDMPFPEEGRYYLTIEKQDGTLLASGEVEISKATPVEVKIEEKEVKGKTIEEIFNQFKPKS